MAGFDNGLEEFAEILNQIGSKISNDETHKKTLAAGAKPIVERAKRIIKNHRRTGRLEKSIMSEYNERGKVQDIGWGGDMNKGGAGGFYGRFLEHGFRPATGKQRSKTKKLIKKLPSNRLVQVPHLKPAYEAEKENAADIMIKTLKEELGGLK